MIRVPNRNDAAIQDLLAVTSPGDAPVGQHPGWGSFFQTVHFSQIGHRFGAASGSFPISQGDAQQPDPAMVRPPAGDLRLLPGRLRRIRAFEHSRTNQLSEHFGTSIGRRALKQL
jgi:hypothetical protein